MVPMDASEQTTLPPVLYHYTSAPGLAGIITPTSWRVDHPGVEAKLEGAALLHASDVRYMNDTQELQFGASIFERRFRVAARSNDIAPPIRSLAGTLADVLSDPDPFNRRNLKCFAACFCESGDLLSQWRGYAGGVGGFALGFAGTALAQDSYFVQPYEHLDPPVRATLKPVVYGQEAGEAAADNFVRLLQAPENWLMKISLETESSTGAWNIVQFVFQEIAVIKHDAFREEREWRLFYSGDLRWPGHIRAGASGLTPYMHIAVNAVQLTEMMNQNNEERVGDPQPTIVDLVVGPSPDQSGQVAAARELVRLGWHDPGVVRASGVPFRG